MAYRDRLLALCLQSRHGSIREYQLRDFWSRTKGESGLLAKAGAKISLQNMADS
jgi:hypothetical protein